MKRFVLTCLTLTLPFFLAACGSVEPDAPVTEPAVDTVSFSIDPNTQEAKLLEAPGSADLSVQGKSGRRVLTGRDLKVKSLEVTFQKGNVIKLNAAFKNVSACNLSEFTFTKGKYTRNIVSSTEPVVTVKDLGGDGILSPKEVSKPLTFKVKHKGKPFVYQVKVEALVSCKAPSLPPGACADLASIPDDVLRESVRRTLNKPKGDITCVDMASLTELDASVFDEMGEPVSVRNLEGLQFATNLTALRFYNGVNNLPDSYLEPLSGLTSLERLTISNLYFPGDDYPNLDLTPLSSLTNLTYLSLPDSQVGDLDALAGLTNLTELSVPSSNVADYSPLSGLTKLVRLDLSSALLSASGRVTDLGFVEKMTALNDLNLYGNAVRDLSPLVNNEGLGDNNDVISLLSNCFNSDEAVKAQAREDIATIEARNPNVQNVNADLDRDNYDFVCSTN